jgi:hypothetical protein
VCITAVRRQTTAGPLQRSAVNGESRLQRCSTRQGRSRRLVCLVSGRTWTPAAGGSATLTDDSEAVAGCDSRSGRGIARYGLIPPNGSHGEQWGHTEDQRPALQGRPIPRPAGAGRRPEYPSLGRPQQAKKQWVALQRLPSDRNRQSRPWKDKAPAWRYQGWCPRGDSDSVSRQRV